MKLVGSILGRLGMKTHVILPFSSNSSSPPRWAFVFAGYEFRNPCSFDFYFRNVYLFENYFNLERFPVKWNRHPIDKLNAVIPRESGEPGNHGRCGVLNLPLSRGMTPQELSERFNIIVNRHHRKSP
jgi:hypothetical protein